MDVLGVSHGCRIYTATSTDTVWTGQYELFDVASHIRPPL